MIFKYSKVIYINLILLKRISGLFPSWKMVSRLGWNSATIYFLNINVFQMICKYINMIFSNVEVFHEPVKIFNTFGFDSLKEWCYFTIENYFHRSAIPNILGEKNKNNPRKKHIELRHCRKWYIKRFCITHLQKFMSIKNPRNSFYVPLVPIGTGVTSYEKLWKVIKSYWFQLQPVMISYEKI